MGGLGCRAGCAEAVETAAAAEEVLLLPESEAAEVTEETTAPPAGDETLLTGAEMEVGTAEKAGGGDRPEVPVPSAYEIIEAGGSELFASI